MRPIQKKLADFLLGVYAAPMNFVLKRMKPAVRLNLKSHYVKHLYSADEYFMISAYPKRVHGLPVKGTERDFSDTAIILQGPIATKDDFTLNTVEMYRQYYNNIKIIVSTWADTDAEHVESLRAVGADVVLSEYPSVNPVGSFNFNYQLTNTLAGIRRAKAIGAKYAVKTRTDQRYYNPCALSLLLGLHKQGKIVTLGGVTNTLHTVPFFISDFLAYGETSELEILYSCEFMTEECGSKLYKERHSEEYDRYHDWSIRAESDCRIIMPQMYDDAFERYACPESILMYNYFLKKTNLCEGETIRDAYIRFLRDFVTIVDANSLGFYWLKYRFQANNPTYFQMDGKLDVAKWFELKQR